MRERNSDYLSLAWLADFWVRGSHHAVPNEPNTHKSPTMTVRETPTHKVQRWRAEHSAELYEAVATREETECLN